MSSEQTLPSQETGNQATTKSKEVTARASFISTASTTSSFYCETAAEVEGRPRRPDPCSVEEWTKNSDEFEAPEQESPSKLATSIDKSINTADHVSLLSPSKSSPSKKKEVRKITPPNPALESSPEQFETGPWSPSNPPPTPIRTPRTPGTPRIARQGTNI